MEREEGTAFSIGVLIGASLGICMMVSLNWISWASSKHACEQKHNVYDCELSPDAFFPAAPRTEE